MILQARKFVSFLLALYLTWVVHFMPPYRGDDRLKRYGYDTDCHYQREELYWTHVKPYEDPDLPGFIVVEYYAKSANALLKGNPVWLLREHCQIECFNN